MSHREKVREVMKVAGAPDVHVDIDIADMKRFRMAAQGGKMRLFRLGPKSNEILPVIGYMLVQIEALVREVAELQGIKPAAKEVKSEPAPALQDVEIPVKRGPGRPRKE